VTAVRAGAAVLLALLAALLWPEGWTDAGWRPEFLLLATLAAGLLGKGDEGAWTGIAAGLAVAPLTLEPFGWDAALLGALGLAVSRTRPSLRADRAGVRATVAGTAALLLGLLRVLRLGAAGAGGPVAPLLATVLAGAAATAVAAPTVLFLLDAAGLFRSRRPGAGRASLV
jgi:rod shape-determining protein MreD